MSHPQSEPNKRVPVVLPKKANLGMKPSAPKARRTRRIFPSIGNNPSSGYTLGTDTITHYVAGGQANQLFDGSTAYLRFTLAYTITAGSGGSVPAGFGLELDYTGLCIINRLDIYHGSQLIESVSRLNLLANLLYDNCHCQSDLFGLSSQIGSMGNGDMVQTNNRRGTQMILPTTGSGLAANGSTTLYYNFCVPILSSIFCLSNSLFPSALLNDDIRLDFVLEPQNTAFVQTGTATNVASSVVKVYNPELSLDYIDVEPTAMEAILNTFRGHDCMLSSTSYHLYETQLQQNVAGGWNSILPCKVMSAKAYFAVFRDLGTTANPSNPGYWTLASRINPFYYKLSSFNLNIGGTRYPQRPITTTQDANIEEYAVETQKAFHSLWDTQYSGSINRIGYISNNYSTATVIPYELPCYRAFMIGINLDNFKNQTDTMYTGIDLSKVSTYMEGNIGGVATPVTSTVSSFVLHDIILHIDPYGNLSSKY